MMGYVHDSETKASVLDHGYIRLVETYGDGDAGEPEAGIIEAARQSTQKNFLGWGKEEYIISATEYASNQENVPEMWASADGGLVGDKSSALRFETADQALLVKGRMRDDGQFGDYELDVVADYTAGDEKLLRYLYENHHDGPFEFAGAIVEVQAPIFVFREWHRHRVQSYNEMSARYAPLPDLNYVPTVERLLLNSKDGNKQAGTVKDAAVLDEWHAKDFQAAIGDFYVASETLYQKALRCGVPKELARVILPVGRYSRMRAHGKLRNWLEFMTLRSAPTAQWEIRQYSLALGDLLARSFPKTMGLFLGGR